MSVKDTFAIQALLARFANSFDVKDWDGLQACLADPLETDYSELRGTPPATVRAADYVQSRREALEGLQTHHLGGNCEIDFADLQNATARLSMVIWRNSEAGEFTTHCVYAFHLIKIGDDWKIGGIAQRILWNEGQPSIHPGAKK
jgi:hypothetical protein